MCISLKYKPKKNRRAVGQGNKLRLTPWPYQLWVPFKSSLCTPCWLPQTHPCLESYGREKAAGLGGKTQRIPGHLGGLVGQMANPWFWLRS